MVRACLYWVQAHKQQPGASADSRCHCPSIQTLHSQGQYQALHGHRQGGLGGLIECLGPRGQAVLQAEP